MKNRETPRPITECTFDFAVGIVKLSLYLDARRKTAKVLGPQIVRAGTSIGANVAEAKAARSKADFISKMNIALKEARETHFRLRVLSAADALPNDRFDPLIQEADELQRILAAIIIFSKRNR